MTAAGIILAIVSAITIAIVLWMFWWAAREDGRDQKRTDARLTAGSGTVPRTLSRFHQKTTSVRSNEIVGSWWLEGLEG